MAWWGKIIGGALGFTILGPLGVLLGSAIGHQFDKGLDNMTRLSGDEGWGAGDQERVQTSFFTALFSVMGHVAKADGVVSADEIAMAKSVMTQMSLNKTQLRIAIELFNKGKQPDFPLKDILRQFRYECHRRRNLLQMFLEVLLQAAYADGVMHPSERSLLQSIAQQLGFTIAELEHLEALVQGHHSRQQYQHGAQQQGGSLKDAYAVLDISENASDHEIKKSYRRMMNQHHPDKLVSKGLPEEMIKMATAKTQEIKAAYEMIRDSRKNK